VTLDHRSELLVRSQALPLELSTPVVEELPGPGLARVIPELAEGLLEQVGGIEALVGGEQELEVLARRAL